MTKERFDIHQHITDKIVSAIERGAGDFRLPWHRAFRNRRFLRRGAGRLTARWQRLEPR
jgi:antirestriction protein ArdC